MSIDIEKARRETPGCATVLHLNNAGASLMPQSVVDAVVDYLHLEATIGGYEAADASTVAIDNTYNAVARLLGCSSDEIALMESATRSWDMAFYSIPFEPGDRILTAVNEYASNYISFLQVQASRGVQIETIPNDCDGCIDLDALRSAIDDRVKLINLTHVSTNSGLIQPAEAVGAIARDAGVLYLLDACQSAGQIPLDVSKIGCDFLSATGRKYLRGPRGTGFLFVRRDLIETLEPPFLDLQAATWTSADSYAIREDARRFEAFESNYAAKIGLGAAIDYIFYWGIDEISLRVQSLAGSLRDQLADIPGITVRDRGQKKCGIVTFTHDSLSPAQIQTALRNQSINIASTFVRHALLDMTDRRLTGMSRASVHYYNTEQELTTFCQALRNLV